MQISEGGCLCSAVRYRVAGTPLYSVVCHCRSCRKAAGAPSVAWVTFERENFLLLSGTAQNYHSSPGVLRTFCALCGTPLTYASEQRPQHVDVTSVSMDDPTLFTPTAEVWIEHRVPWEALSGQLTHHPRGDIS
jgi:hypothetical protein